MVLSAETLLVPFVSAAVGGCAALIGVIYKGKLDHQLERERQRVGLLIAYHQERLAAAAEVAATALEAEMPLLGMIQGGSTEYQTESARQLLAVLTKVRVAAERYGQMESTNTYLAEVVEAWTIEMYALVSKKKELYFDDLKPITAQIFKVCRELVSVERERMAEHIKSLAVRPKKPPFWKRSRPSSP